MHPQRRMTADHLLFHNEVSRFIVSWQKEMLAITVSSITCFASSPLTVPHGVVALFASKTGPRQGNRIVHLVLGDTVWSHDISVLRFLGDMVKQQYGASELRAARVSCNMLMEFRRAERELETSMICSILKSQFSDCWRDATHASLVGLSRGAKILSCEAAAMALRIPKEGLYRLRWGYWMDTRHTMMVQATSYHWRFVKEVGLSRGMAGCAFVLPSVCLHLAIGLPATSQMEHESHIPLNRCARLVIGLRMQLWQGDWTWVWDSENSATRISIYYITTWTEKCIEHGATNIKGGSVD